MTDELVKEKIKASVLSLESDAQIILFGSRATANEHAESDWDILVLLNQALVTFKDEQRIRHSLFDLELEIEQPISTFVYALDEWNTKMKVTPLYKNIQREGISL
jgi:uncharacterized protein